MGNLCWPLRLEGTPPALPLSHVFVFFLPRQPLLWEAILFPLLSYLLFLSPLTFIRLKSWAYFTILNDVYACESVHMSVGA